MSKTLDSPIVSNIGGATAQDLAVAAAPHIASLRSEKHRVSHRACFTKLEDALNRRPMVSDLNAWTADRLVSHMRENGYQQTTVTYTCALIRAIWRKLLNARPDVPPLTRAFIPIPKKEPRFSPGMFDKSFPPLDDPQASARDLMLFFLKTYRPRRLLGKSEKTIKKYLTVVRNFAQFLDRRPTLDDLNEDSIPAYLETRLASRASATAESERSHLMALANYAARQRLIEKFIEVRPIDEMLEPPKAWSLADLHRLLDAYRNAEGEVDGLPAGEWFVALHRVALYVGERSGALFWLRWGWINRQTGKLIVPAKARKGKRKSMTYTLPPEVLTEVNALWRPERVGIFMEPGCKELATIRNRMTKIQKAAGLPYGGRDKLHRMRRTFASLIEKAGGDATAALAHSSRKVTVESYLDEELIARPPSSDLIVKALSDACATLSSPFQAGA